MTWRVVFRPEVEEDVVQAATWYDEQQPGLSTEFLENVIAVWGALAENPLLNSRRHPRRNVRWRYTDNFPYRVIFEVIESERMIIVVAVLHAARHDREWRQRFEDGVE